MLPILEYQNEPVIYADFAIVCQRALADDGWKSWQHSATHHSIIPLFHYSRWIIYWHSQWSL